MATPGDRTSSKANNSPLLIFGVLILLGMFFATLLWFSARREVAAVYGFIRSVEFPLVNRLVPYAEYFRYDNLKEGIVPGFTAIYLNSVIYGIVFTMLILILMAVALARMDKHSIKPHVTIKASKGRTYQEVLERIGRTDPSVRFFADYNMLDLPTNIGTARQPFKALEVLLYLDAIKAVVIDSEGKEYPKLSIDSEKMRNWMTEQFGHKNPFMDLPHNRLLEKEEIDASVDALSWYSVLVLYPALSRLHAFNVEDEKGYETAQRQIEEFIDSIWDELNGFRKEFGDAITLGFANAEDREERNALYKARKKGRRKPEAKKGRFKRKKGGEAEIIQPAGEDPHTSIDNITEMELIYRLGRIERGEIEVAATVERSNAGPLRQKKKAEPENLLFFGEVLEERGPGMNCVAEARKQLKWLLTRHLGRQTGEYPVGTDPKTHRIRYAKMIETPEEKAFNKIAQDKLAKAEAAIERVLFRHQYEFSVAGGALDAARRYGIMPPNLFRFMRFSEETRPFFWFVHNLGMPSAVPENAGQFEHYRVEQLIGVAIERPFVQSALEGLRQEAERYLTPETIAELRSILGRSAIVTRVVQGKELRGVLDKFDTKGDWIGETVNAEIGQGGAATKQAQSGHRAATGRQSEDRPTSGAGGPLDASTKRQRRRGDRDQVRKHFAAFIQDAGVDVPKSGTKAPDDDEVPGVIRPGQEDPRDDDIPD